MKTNPIPLRWWDLPASLLLMAAIITSATRLVATDWTDHLSIVQTLVFFGLLAGLALGYSRFSSKTAGFLAVIFGLFTIPWQLGLTLPANLPWLERMILLISRLQVILTQLFFREPVRDSLLFLVVMFILYWAVSIHAGYALTRHGDGWLAILPGGLSMFVIHSFDSAVSSRIWYLAVYLFFSLILVARMTFLHYHTTWRESRTTLPPHISLDFIRYTILAVFVIVLFAWTMPALAKAMPQASRAWQPVRTAWNSSVNKFENAFASLKATVFTYTAVYSPTSSLGRGSVLTDNQVFIASAPEDLPVEARLYWRARVYDTYENGQWRTSLDTRRSFSPATEELPVEPGIGRWQGSFSITSASNITTLITPAQPLWVSRFGNLEFTENPDGTIDLATIAADPPVAVGEKYDTLASIGVPTVEELRNAGTDYPEWVSERYLQLPPSITPRTIALAQEITAGLETPYDKVAAITRYLRENIEYVEVLDDLPPANQEPVDWFLFDAKTGFCNYYSSAEIVLLRSLGIPARWAVGYAQGEVLNEQVIGSDIEESFYIVRQRDAHAWPEVYFPDYGWIEFEPTVSQPSIDRPSGSETFLNDPFNEEEELAALREDKREQLNLLREASRERGPEETPVAPENRVSWIVLLSGLAVLVIIGLWLLPAFGLPTAPSLLLALFLRSGLEAPAPIKLLAEKAETLPKPKPIRLPPIVLTLENVFRRLGIRPPEILQRWARQAELPPLSKAYIEINRGLSLFGTKPAPTDTPAERAAALTQYVPPVEQPARELVNQYQLGTFGNQPADLDLARKSASTIRNQSLRAFIQNYFRRFQKPDPAQPLNRKHSPDGRKPER